MSDRVALQASDPSYARLTRLMKVLKRTTSEGSIIWRRTRFDGFRLDVLHGAISVVGDDVLIYDANGELKREFVDAEMMKIIESRHIDEVDALVVAIIEDINKEATR